MKSSALGPIGFSTSAISLGPPTTYAFGSGKNWLFLIEDGEDSDAYGLAYSSESGNDVHVGRCTPTVTGVTRVEDPIDLVTAADLKQDFTNSAGTPEESYDSLADHWHIYAHGYHWIAVSLVYDAAGCGVLLIKFSLDKSGEWTDEWRKVVQDPEWDSRSPPNVLNPTNDLCMVEGPDGGVYVVVDSAPAFRSGPPPATTDDPFYDQGTLWIPVDRDGAVGTKVVVNGTSSAPELAHYGGASVTRRGKYGGAPGPSYRFSSYRLLAPEFTAVSQDSDIKLIVLDADLDSTAASVETLVSRTGHAYSMVTEVWIDSARAMVIKGVETGASGESGRLWLYTYGRPTTTTPDAMERLLDDIGDPITMGQRPHVVYWESNNLLIVAFDIEGTNLTFLNVRKVR